jgi:hypothetical protein
MGQARGISHVSPRCMAVWSASHRGATTYPDVGMYDVASGIIAGENPSLPSPPHPIPSPPLPCFPYMASASEPKKFLGTADARIGEF